MTGAPPKAPAGRARAYPSVCVASRAELRAWLERNHASVRGAWIVTEKVSAGGSVRWDDIVEEVLCFGWIDSAPRKVDARRTSLLVTPRKPTSRWSAKNKAHVDDLERRGLLTPAGRAAITRARENGTWDALDAVAALFVPEDLTRALDAHAGARRHWEAFPLSAQRGILEWISNARRPDTRARRVEETARLASEGRRANAWPRA